MSARRSDTGDLTPSLELHEAGLASDPWSIAVVVLVWLGTGLGIAWRESRRGHELRHLVPLGFAFGPLLGGFARSTLRLHESAAQPVVLRGREGAAPARRILVAVLGRPDHVADVRPFLGLVATDDTELALVRPITFDAARADGHDADRARAARDLERAALFVHDLDPELTLIPGRRGDAIARYTADHPADLVVVVDDDPSGRRSGRATIDVVAIPGPDHLVR